MATMRSRLIWRALKTVAMAPGAELAHQLVTGNVLALAVHLDGLFQPGKLARRDDAIGDEQVAERLRWLGSLPWRMDFLALLNFVLRGQSLVDQQACQLIVTAKSPEGLRSVVISRL